MSEFLTALFVLGAVLTGASVIIFCAGCSILLDTIEALNRRPDISEWFSEDRQKAIRIVIIAYILLFLGALAFIVVFMLR